MSDDNSPYALIYLGEDSYVVDKQVASSYDSLIEHADRLSAERDAALARVAYLEKAMRRLTKPPPEFDNNPGKTIWVNHENIAWFATAALSGTWKPEEVEK